MIEGVIFDFDGTLIDSEPMWNQAGIDVFRNEGVELTHDDVVEAKGLASYESVALFLTKVEKPTRSIAEITADINKHVIDVVKEGVELKPGVRDVLDFIAQKNIPMAICSSSPFRLIQEAVEKLDIKSYFKFLYSSDFERHGKPHPGIYISTAKKLDVNPIRCMAFEDSFNGILAAKAARIRTVALLDEGQFNDTKYDFADLKIESFNNFGSAEYDFMSSLIK
ncbi:MAG: HAD-IA family hydrolase [Bacteroidales bacterium]|nr:HAD-IA family hydrolase [Bacteroidales bacterium]